MKKHLATMAGAALLALTPVVPLHAQVVAGHTTLAVGNYTNGSLLPTGQFITPIAAPGSTLQQLTTGLRPDGAADAAQAVNTQLSPDGKTLLILTSGWNHGFDKEDGTPITYPTIDPVTGAQSGKTTGNAEWVFVFHINPDGTAVKQQQINIPNTYSGLTWAPDGTRFYVSGGEDDRVYVYKHSGSLYVADAPFILLGHNSNQTAPLSTTDGGILKGTKAAQAAPAIVTGSVTAGIAVSLDGKTLVATNMQNDSISIVNTATRQVTKDVHFFVPGGTVAQGEFPYDVAILSNTDGSAKTAYVTSLRDNQVMAVDIASGTFSPIAIGGQPNRLIISSDKKSVYAVNGNDDTISVIDTASNAVVRTLSLGRPGEKYKGSNPNSVTISPDGNTLYATLGFENAVVVVNLENGNVEGRIPTGWYPTSVSVGKDGRTLYVSTFKSNAGPNPGNAGPNPTFRASRSYPLEKAQLNVIPVPDAGSLATLSAQVDNNNGLSNRRANAMMTFLHSKIQHVIYIIKENKTYDQILGDMPNGNGDPSLNLFPEPISPNHHSLASTFALMDNFYATGEVSGTGWNWATYGTATDYNEKTIAVNYGNGGGGVTADDEGTNRFIAVGLPEVAPKPLPASPFTERLLTLLDPTGSSNILPGTKDVNGPAGANDLNADAVGGYLWDSVLRAKKTVRNYGFFLDQSYYLSSGGDPTKADPSVPTYLPISTTPFASNKPQAPAEEPELIDKTDVYFRGFDQNNSDVYLYNEWARDMAVNGLPALTLLRLPHDHNGSFGTALAGLGTAALQISDNDYAIGLVVDHISHSQYWNNTLIAILEDDAQNGGDHVDSHRSFAYLISPYTKRGVTIQTNYNTVNVLRTMEDVLGIDHLNFSDADAAPMADLFSQTANFTPYASIIPGDLCAAPVDPGLVPACQNPKSIITAALPDLHNSQWWAAKTKGFDFSDADKIDSDAFNRVIWQGMKGEDVPYPAVRSGADLRKNRAELLKRWRESEAKRIAAKQSNTKKVVQTSSNQANVAASR
jgi:YVTN family beta-propeller protein